MKIVIKLLILISLTACSGRRIVETGSVNYSTSNLNLFIRSKLDSSMAGAYFVLKTTSKSDSNIYSLISNKIFLMSRDTLYIVGVEMNNSTLKESNVSKRAFYNDTVSLASCDSLHEKMEITNSRYVAKGWGNDTFYFHYVTSNQEKLIIFKSSDCWTDQKCLICELLEFAK